MANILVLVALNNRVGSKGFVCPLALADTMATDQGMSSTLAITLHSKPRRLGVRRRPWGLLPSRSPEGTGKKSHWTAVLCALAPERRRRLGAVCRAKRSSQPSLLRDDETLKEQQRQEAEEHDQQTTQEAPKDQQQKEQEPQK